MVEHGHDLAGLDRAISKHVKPRATEVRQSGVVHVQDVAQRANDTGVADDECRAVLAATADVTKRTGHALEDVVVALEAFGLSSLLQIARPLLLDLGTGETLPRADMCFLKTFVDFDGSNAEMFGDDRRRVSGTFQVAGGYQFERAEHVGGEGRLTDAFVAERNVGTTLPAFLDVPQRLTMSQDQQRTHYLATIHGNAG